MARTKAPGEVRPKKKTTRTGRSFHFVPDDIIEHKDRLLELYPVRTIDDFTPDQIAEMERLYKPTKPIEPFCLNSIIKFGTYQDLTVLEVINKNPAWVLWAVKSVRNFQITNIAAKVLRKRMEYGTPQEAN